MTYHELIELYKKGKLDDDQKAKLEKDIERQDAIGEYLIDQEDMAGFSELFQEEDQEADAEGFSQETDKEEEKFTKTIRSVIRKMFIRMGVIVGVAVFAVVCFVIFALPQIVDLFYYDPTEVVGMNEHGMETNRLSLDLAVYTELFCPTSYRYDAEVISKGNGEYDITICQNISYNGRFTDVAGYIKKGEMTLYDPNTLSPVAMGAFDPPSDIVDDHYEMVSSWNTREQSIARIQSLNADEYYVAYVTLNDVMKYNEFVKWDQENNVGSNWCVICEKVNNEETEYVSWDIIGFYYQAAAASGLNYDADKYPLLSYYDVMQTNRDENENISEENMKQHVISMLRFMADETGFCEMMDLEGRYITDLNHLADNVEEYGLNIYGFTVIGKKEALLKLCELEEVAYITANPLE